MRQFVHVKSTCSNIRSHKKLCAMLTEFLHGQIALRLCQISVQSLCTIPIFDELISHLLRFETCAAEDNAINARVVVHNSFECGIFVLCFHEIIRMIHVFSTFIAATHHNFLVIFEITLRNALNLWSHCRREKKRLTLFWQICKNFINAIGEAHVEHFVRFVKHNVAHTVQLCHLAVHQVDETSRSSHNDLTTLLELTNLSFNAGATIDSHHVKPINVATIIFQVVSNLQTEFACWTQNHHLRGAIFGINVL